MAHTYKVGDRVRRNGYKFYGGPPVGSLGTVEGCETRPQEDAHLIRWDGNDETSYWSGDRLELHAIGPAAPPPVPEPCLSKCGPLRCERDQWHPGTCAANVGHPNEYRWSSAGPAEQSTQQGLGGEPPGDKRSEEAKLADDLCEQMHPFVGEGEAGRHGEGARECLQRLLCELRDRRGECATLRAQVARLEKALDLSIAKKVRR